MNILVTGAAGFIGSHVVEALIRQGHRVLGVDNLSTGSRANIDLLNKNAEFKWIEQNIVEPFEIEEPIERIYHLACPASPLDYAQAPIETLLTSSHGTKNVLDIAVEKKARILFASTSEVYGDPLEHPQREKYWGNVNPIGTRSCYDEGKRYAESLMMNYSHEFGVETRIIRIFNTYGPRMRSHDGRVIPNFIQQVLSGESITIYGEGTQTRSFCYVDDMVKALLGFMEAEKVEGPVNWGNPEEVTIKELAELIIKLVGKDNPLLYKPLPKDDPSRRCPDIGKGERILGWRPQVALEEGLEKTIAFFK